MKQIIRLSAACAALIAGPVFAADYDPPIYIEEAPEFVPVEIGSGWYLRGDISYNAGRPIHNAALLGISNRRYGGGIGVGYHFTDNFRGDLTLNYNGSDRLDYKDGIQILSGSYNTWSGLVSGYYDIATVVGITPYIGAGLGVQRSKAEISSSLGKSYTGNLQLPYRNSDYSFAYALMAGAAYKVTDNVSVDLGYQFLHAPNAKYIATDTPEIREGTKQHLLKVGLRYDLW